MSTTSLTAQDIAVHLEHRRIVGVGELRGASDDRVQDGGKVCRRGGDDAEHLRRRGELSFMACHPG